MTRELCLLFLELTATYFIAVNGFYGVLTLLSWLSVRKQKYADNEVRELPPVSFIVPAFNEESLIVETIQTYLSLKINKEVIVIDDGSHDNTMKLLRTMYQLRQFGSGPYRSITHPELMVLSASHMGKAQALNYGVTYASHDIICTMDADTVPDSRGVNACLRAFAQDAKLISAGGVIHVLGGQVLKDNSPVNPRHPGWLTSFQRIEYLRTFLCERPGWSFLGSTLLISGAFCMLKKEALQKVGGFRQNSITEDFDLIVRLRRHFKGKDHHFKVLPVTACYTQAPNGLTHLKRQRMRWQMGLVQTLWQNLGMFFSPKHGTVGIFAVPYFWIVEAFSPVVEIITMLTIPFALSEGWIQWSHVLTFLGAGLAFNVLITIFGIWLDEKHVSREKNWPYLASVLDGVFLHFGYKQLNALWRLMALVKVMKNEQGWGEKPREEIIHQAT